MHHGLDQPAPGRGQVCAGPLSCGPGFDHGLGNVLGAGKSAADVHPFTAGSGRVEGRSPAEHSFGQVQAEFSGQGLSFGVRFQAHGQDHQVVIPYSGLSVIADPGQAPRVSVRGRVHGVDAAADKTHAVLVPGVVVAFLEPFAVGAQVHVKNVAVQFFRGMLLGDDGLFDGVHAADRRTVEMIAPVDVPGAHALEPGDAPGSVLSDGRIRWPPVGPEADRSRSNSREVTTSGCSPYWYNPMPLGSKAEKPGARTMDPTSRVRLRS